MVIKVFKKCVYAIITCIAAIGFSIFIVLATPGNPAQMLLIGFLQRGIPYDQAIEMVRAYVGFSPEEPLAVAWLRYMQQILAGNLGVSVMYRIPAIRLIADALPWTLFFVSVSLFITVIVGLLTGLILAYFRRKVFLVNILRSILSILNSIPNWILAAIFFVYIGARWRLLPYTGAFDPELQPGFYFEFILSVLRHYTLPMLVMILSLIPGWTFNMAAMASTVLKEDYVTAAKARGLPSRRIMIFYIAKNSVLPIYTQIAIMFSWLLIGTVWIESQFLLPGLGSLLSIVIGARDYPVIISIYVIFIVAMIAGNFLTDLTYTLIDPRARVGEEG